MGTNLPFFNHTSCGDSPIAFGHLQLMLAMYSAFGPFFSLTLVVCLSVGVISRNNWCHRVFFQVVAGLLLYAQTTYTKLWVCVF